MGVSARNANQTRWFCHFGVFSCHFGKTPEQVVEKYIWHCRGIQMGQVARKSEPFGQEVMVPQAFDASDGSSIPSKRDISVVSAPFWMI
jgi:hypothetical protein